MRRRLRKCKKARFPKPLLLMNEDEYEEAASEMEENLISEAAFQMNEDEYKQTASESKEILFSEAVMIIQ